MCAVVLAVRRAGAFGPSRIDPCRLAIVASPVDFSSTMSQHDKAQQVQAVSIASNPSSTSAWLTRSSTLQPSMRVLACHIATGDWIERDLGDRSHLTQSGSFIDDYVISFRREILARWLAVISWHHWNLSSLERNFFTAAQPLLCTSTAAESELRSSVTPQ